MKTLILSVLLIISGQGYSELRPKLADCKYNVYSQWGEDGIIAEIFNKIGTKSKVAIEFGSANGFWLSNTANLWSHDPEWTALLIEANEGSYNQLVKNVESYNCIPLLRLVGTSENNSLETILEEIQFPKNIDLLSIDIDGDDYYIFQSLKTVRPRLIIVEYNPSIPAYLDVYPSLNNYMGCSVAALERIASEKGYRLVAITETNCFFVLEEEFPKLCMYETERDKIRIDKFVSYIISDYSGKHAVIGNENFTDPWGWNGSHLETECNGAIKILPATVLK